MFSIAGKYLLAAVIMSVITLGAPALAHAQWRVQDLNPFNPGSESSKSLREFDKARLNAMAPGFRAGRDYTKVYVKNETKDTIWVAIIDIPFVVVQGNATIIDDPQTSPWHVHAWYQLAPNERKHVSNTSNRNVYVYAQNNRGITWTGKTRHEVPDNGKRRLVDFRQESFTDTPEEYAISFKP